MATTELTQPTGHNMIASYRELDPEQFAIQHDVPVFAEHETEETDAAGQPRKVQYTREILAAICENQNRRIRDTGDYTAITLGHTPTSDEESAGKQQPPVIGFAGPFSLGVIGNEKPRWAIIARNWAIFKDQVDKARRHPRRSVEIYQEGDPHQRYFDPIAVLGSVMPRLDLGMAYSRLRPGVRVGRYAAAAPSATNVFIPSEKYQADDGAANPNPQEAAPMALSDEDIQKFVAAMLQTEELQFVRSQMDASQAKGAPPVDDPATPGIDEGATGGPGEPPAPPATPPAAPPPPAAPAAGPPEEEKAKMGMPYQQPDVVTKARYAKIERDNDDLRKRLDALESDKRRIERYSQIERLSYEFALDLEEETARVEKMNDDQFTDHCGVIAKHYQKIPAGNQPFRVAPAVVVKGQPAGITEDQKQAAVNLATKYQKEGKPITFGEALEKVKAGAA